MSIELKKFDTIYVLHCNQTGALLKYASYVLAPDMKRAQQKVKLRNIDEQIQNNGLPYEEDDLTNALSLFDKGHFKHCLHAITFMSYVLVKSGRITSDYVLNDIGLIHELIHIITDCSTTSLSITRSKLEQFQNSYNSISH